FASDPQVVAALGTLLPILAVSMPIAGYVFVLDGVLMGAEDARYLALAQLVAVIGYAILLVPLAGLWPGSPGLWAAFCIAVVGFRALALGWRVRNRAWIDRAAEKGISCPLRRTALMDLKAPPPRRRPHHCAAASVLCRPTPTKRPSFHSSTCASTGR